MNISFVYQFMGRNNRIIFVMLWIFNIPQRPCVRDLVTSLPHYQECYWTEVWLLDSKEVVRQKQVLLKSWNVEMELSPSYPDSPTPKVLGSSDKWQVLRGTRGPGPCVLGGVIHPAYLEAFVFFFFSDHVMVWIWWVTQKRPCINRFVLSSRCYFEKFWKH